MAKMGAAAESGARETGAQASAGSAGTTPQSQQPETGAAQAAQASQAEGGAGETAPIDWEARYREMQKHARTWETRAKSNERAAEELKKLQDAGKSDLELATERAKRAEDELASLKHERDLGEWRKKVSAETGIPADVIEGATLEDMQDHASRLAPYFKSDAAPVVGSDGRKAKGAASSKADAFFNAIEGIL